MPTLQFKGKNIIWNHHLKQGLLTIAQIEDVKEAVSSMHGVKYIIDGLLQTPVGDTIMIRTIWIIDKGQTRPRFVTTYPV